ncbi:MAG: flagellar hook-associated protein FlgL, partial [Lachnospiraceae bacterium]|nr:flagellar hook-associated protein FlgL [Lachnospiraceae bacterium]
MRITNGMMINNTLSHINMNKLNVDKYSTQQSTGKKIQKPSDDPIIAVRALRFRSQLAELNQYLEKNIPDAESWLEVTEEALGGVSGMLSEMQKYMEQGAQDTLDLANRSAVIDTLKQYREQIYENANADFAGRRIFTGYKTDTDMTFASDAKDVK